MTRLLTIVEGEGDRKAVPVLIRRLLHEVHNRFDVQQLPAQPRGEWPRVKRDFERFYLSARLEEAPILWVLDFDCHDCIDPRSERAWLQREAQRIDPRGVVEVVFMIKEFESIFLWDEAFLRRTFPELPNNIELPANPESIRNAKGWISRSLPKGRAYKETTDQARMAATIELNPLRLASSSMQRLEKSLLKLI